MPGLTVGSVATETELAANLAAVAAYGLAGSRHVMPSEPLDASAWRALLDAVARERLAGLLGLAITDGVFPARAAQIEEAATLETDAAVVALLLERLLLVVADRFAAAGLEYRVLKGPAVAYVDYPQPALRCFGDLDLLVRGADFARAIEVLEGTGGERGTPELRRGFDHRFGKGATIAMPGDLEIDLHRSFVAGPLGMTIDLDGLFATQTPFALAGRDLPGLGSAERFLHACIHAGLDRPARLHSLRDIAQMGLRTDLDLDRVFALARAWQATAVLARAVHLAWTTLDIADSIPLSAWAAKYHPDRRESRLIDAYVGGDQSFTRRAVATMRVIPRRRDKVAYARSLVFPERRFLAARGGTRREHVRRGTAHLRWGIPR